MVGCSIARVDSMLQGFITLEGILSSSEVGGVSGKMAGISLLPAISLIGVELIKALIILNSNEPITLSSCGFFPRTALARMPKRVETTTVSSFPSQTMTDGLGTFR